MIEPNRNGDLAIGRATTNSRKYYSLTALTIANMFAARATLIRLFRTSARTLAKGDKSTIDLFRLPSQTSINDWEFRYDFMPKVATPKTPAVTEEAVKSQIAEDKVKQVERELFAQESNQSAVSEGSHAKVLHGGEHVEHTPIDDVATTEASTPVDVSRPQATDLASVKPVNQEKYVHALTNPDLNKPEVVNLGADNEVDHKTQPISQAEVVDDIEHDNLKHAGQEQPKNQGGSKVPIGVIAGVAIGTAGYYFMAQPKDKPLQPKQ